MEQRLMQKKQTGSGATKTVDKVQQLEQNPIATAFAQEKKKLRVPRTKKYIKLMQEIDQLSEQDKEIMDMVQSMPVNNKLLGILSECGITGCIIHAIDKWGNILAHFRSMDEMSSDLQAGYEIFLQHPGCTSVEVYTHTFCIIYNDGVVKFVERDV